MESPNKRERLLPSLAPIADPDPRPLHRLTALERICLTVPRLCHGAALLVRGGVGFFSRLLTTFPVLEVMGLAGLVFLLGR